MAEKIRNEKQADSKHKENKHSGQHQHGKLVARPDKAIHAKISSISMNTSNVSDKKSNDCNISCAPSYSSNITLTRSGYLPSPLRLDNRGTFFDSCNIDNESNSNSNEVFFPSKDHIFLTETIDTTTMSRHRNTNKDIEVDVSTSLVKSPARVIRHHHHQQPQHFFRQNSDSGNVTAILPSTIANTTNSSVANLASPNFQNSEIKCSHLEQQRQLDKKINRGPDMKEDPLRKQIKKKGQIVASRYMQPSKGPLKATEKIMPTTTTQQPSSRNVSGGLLQRSSSLKKSNLNKAPAQSSQSSINKSFHSSKGNMSPAQQQQQHHHKRSQSSKDDNKASGPLQQQRLQQTTTTKKQFFPIPTLNSSSDKQSTTSLNQDGHTDADGNHDDDDDARSLRHHMKDTPTLSDADVTKPHQHKRGLTSSTPNMLHSTMQAKGPDLSSYMHSVGGMDVSSIAPLDQTKQLESAQVTKDLFTSIINQSQALDDKQSKLAKKSYKNGAKNNSSSSSSSSSSKMASQTKFDINLIYSRYIQYVYLNAMIEQCSQKQFKRAMEELHELWLLAEETSQRKHDLQLELRELERLESTSQAVSILEETLPSISGQIDEFTYMHDKLTKSLDSKRHVMPVSGDVYLPDEKLEDAYYAGLTSELKSVHESLQEMMRKIGGEPIQLLELKDSAHEMKQITPQFIDESNKCRSAIVEAVDALTEHRFMKIANNNDNNKTSPPKFKLPWDS